MEKFVGVAPDHLHTAQLDGSRVAAVQMEPGPERLPGQCLEDVFD